jgi:hypothetical protein
MLIFDWTLPTEGGAQMSLVAIFSDRERNDERI